MNNQHNHIKKVAIIGLGYVGIPLCKAFLDAGVNVIGIDVNKERVNELNNNIMTLNHLSNIDINSFLKKNQVKFSLDFKECSKCDAVIICVPTPLDKYKQPDLGPIKGVINSLIPYLTKNQIISLESTTYPGTCKDELVVPFEVEGYKVGKDIHVVYSPEREDPGNRNFDCHNTPKVIGGFTQNCLKKGLDLYSIINDQPIPVSSCEVAEFSKLYENIYRSVNIALANEMKVIADKLGLDIYEIINAAATKPFGFSAFYPGPGVGGHCIPVDPAYLNWKAKSENVHSKMIDTAMEVNKNITQFVVNKTSKMLNKQNKSISSSNILILGISYKSNVDDIRESPAIDIAEQLLELKANLSYDDRFIPKTSLKGKLSMVKELKEVTNSKKLIQNFDAILLLTAHDYYNYDNLKAYSNLIIDTRGVLSNQSPNVERA